MSRTSAGTALRQTIWRSRVFRLMRRMAKTSSRSALAKWNSDDSDTKLRASPRFASCKQMTAQINQLRLKLDMAKRYWSFVFQHTSTLLKTTSLEPLCGVTGPQLLRLFLLSLANCELRLKI